PFPTIRRSAPSPPRFAERAGCERGERTGVPRARRRAEGYEAGTVSVGTSTLRAPPVAPFGQLRLPLPEMGPDAGAPPGRVLAVRVPYVPGIPDPAERPHQSEQGLSAALAAISRRVRRRR